jgi:hypothetical protein
VIAHAIIPGRMRAKRTRNPDIPGPRFARFGMTKENLMQPTPLTERHYYDAAHTTPRWLSDLYCLWRLCPATRCRRAQACRGDVQICQPGLALVPTDARDFIACLEDARDDGLSYDEMIDVYSEELDALERWRGQVEMSMRE